MKGYLNFRWIILIVLILTTVLLDNSFSKPTAEVKRVSLSEFPAKVGDWEMVNEQEIDDASMAVLLVDDYIMRTYKSPDDQYISLYVGYFNYQAEGKQVHSPRQCLPGAGWSILDNREQMFPLDGGARSAPMNLYTMGKGDEKELYLWWYQGRGRIYANEYLNKVYLLVDAIFKNRTDGALVRLNMRIRDSKEATLKEEMEFAHQLVALLPSYIPD